MFVKCQNCVEMTEVNGLGRRPLAIPLKNVCEALQAHRNVVAATQELGCSEAYVYSVLKANGLRLKDVVTLRQVETKGVIK